MSPKRVFHHPLVNEWLHNYVSKNIRNYYTKHFICEEFLDEHPDFLRTLERQGYKKPLMELRRYITSYFTAHDCDFELVTPNGQNRRSCWHRREPCKVIDI